MWCPFSVDDALDCWVGGLVCQHHNEVRDAVGDLVSLCGDRFRESFCLHVRQLLMVLVTKL